MPIAAPSLAGKRSTLTVFEQVSSLFSALHEIFTRHTITLVPSANPYVVHGGIQPPAGLPRHWDHARHNFAFVCPCNFSSSILPYHRIRLLCPSKITRKEITMSRHNRLPPLLLLFSFARISPRNTVANTRSFLSIHSFVFSPNERTNENSSRSFSLNLTSNCSNNAVKFDAGDEFSRGIRAANGGNGEYRWIDPYSRVYRERLSVSGRPITYNASRIKRREHWPKA